LRIRAAILLTLAATGLAACAPTTDAGRYRDDVVRANPSRVIAAELAFARAAQEKGQWTAFAEYATGDAVMFVPEPVNARNWLRRQANPPQAVRWQPHQVWSSCDGSLAVTKGAWQRPDGSTGYFTTVWSRQRSGDYKWVMDQGDALAEPLPEPEMIQASVAECVPAPRRRSQELPRATVYGQSCTAGACRGGAVSADGSLAYEYSVDPSGARLVTVQLREDGAMREVLRSQASG
jgi:hypothetical protein